VTLPYNIGVGIADVTDPAIGLPMQGMADEAQVTTGVDSPLYARAFVVVDAANGTCVAIVIADIWAGTRRVKDSVLRRLAARYGPLFSEENLLLAGTHTHSAPGGFSGTLMYDYDFARGGVDDATVTCLVDGCVSAVEMAQQSLAPGRILVGSDDVADCGANRSPQAYVCNPQVERNRWGADTDREMLLLKFVHGGDGAPEQAIGSINWYPIHPTDLGQKNTLVSGDNKGWASALFEEHMRVGGDTFVAAFANSNCGDVSGNVELGHIPDGIHDHAQMEKHGKQQFDVARTLFDAAAEEVSGPVAHRHTRADFSHLATGLHGARTWPAGLGVSFTAGSSEDSVPNPDLGIPEGRTVDNLSDGEAVIAGVAGLGLSLIFGIDVLDQATAIPEREGHLPKPVVLMPGIEQPSAVPQVLPVQLFRIGTFALVGIPGELTTMAGRRLRETIADALSAAGVKHVALGTYANEYSQYITTREEYSSQQYEGASTLFGPHTLEAYQLVTGRLASAIASDVPVAAGPAPSPWTSAPQRRYRFRNLSGSAVELKFYNVHDHLRWLTLPNGTKTIAAGAEVAYPQREFTGPLLPTIGRVTVTVGGHEHPMMYAGQLMTIAADGSVSVGAYTPPARS
jgi:neutral ceramidase